MMNKEQKILAIIISFILLGCTTFTIGCMSEKEQNTPVDSLSPISTGPAFQPSILDKHIINPPIGEEWSSCPFLFEFDLRNKTGFRDIESNQPGAPVLALIPDSTAIIPIIISSETDTKIWISRTDGVPDEVQVSYYPSSFTIGAQEKTHIDMHITTSRSPNVPEKTSVVVWMKDTGGWEVGKAFHLREMGSVQARWTPTPFQE